jgi:DNA-binding MarR family transcriptional regulator
MAERESSAYRLAKLVKRARRQMTNAIRDRLEPTGISLAAVHVIRRITDGGELNQLDLARQIELEPAALHRLVVDLEAKGLVARRRDEVDKRRVLVAPTDAGRTLLARSQPHVHEAIETMASRLTRPKQAELCRLLEALVGDDEARNAPPGTRDVRPPVARSPRRAARRRTS